MRRARVIINPAAGAGHAALRWPDVVRALRAHDIDPDFVLTEHSGHAMTLAARLSDDVDLVIAVGGDGTASEVANGLLTLSAPPPMGVVQTGTGRDLARAFGQPRDLEAQVRQLARAPEMRIDVGWCGHTADGAPARRAMLITAGAGFPARVVERSIALKRLGPLAAYFGASILEWWRNESAEARLVLDGEDHSGEVLGLLLMNLPWAGGGMLLGPGADPDDGRYEVTAISRLPRRGTLPILLRLYGGGHVSQAGVHYAAYRNAEFQPARPQAVTVDGELVGHTPLTVQVAPRALAVLAAEVRSG